MYMSKEDLLKIVKDHNLRGCVNYNKSQLVQKLASEGLLPDDVTATDKNQNRYKFISKIRSGKKEVRVTDSESGEVQTYPSIYSCSKALHANPGTIKFFNGRKYSGKYTIEILD